MKEIIKFVSNLTETERLQRETVLIPSYIFFKTYRIGIKNTGFQ